MNFLAILFGTFLLLVLVLALASALIQALGGPLFTLAIFIVGALIYNSWRKHHDRSRS